MIADVEIIEGGKLIKTEKMKLRKVKEYDDDIVMYENEDGRSVMYLKKENKYTLISIEMA